MRCVFVIAVLLCLYSCKKNSNKSDLSDHFVQTKDVQLVNPKIETKSVIIDSSSSITALLDLDQAVIYYTTDGSEPDETSNKYTNSISISKPGKYTFKAFHLDFKPSDAIDVSFFNKGVDVHSIDLETALNKQYPGKGQNTLVNGEKGTLNFRDGEWLGVTEPFIAIVEFDDVMYIESIDIGYLVNTDSWIFPIQDISIDFSEDGINYMPIGPIKKIEKQESNSTKLENINISVSKRLKKMKIKISNVTAIPKWHQGKGNPAWLFMDEWIFNTKKN